MHRRQFLASTSLLSAAVALPGAVSAATRSRDADFRAMLDRFFYDRLQDSPEQATSLGLDTGARAGLKSRLDDTSRAGEAKQFARARQELAALKSVRRDALSPTAQLDYDVVQ